MINQNITFSPALSALGVQQRPQVSLGALPPIIEKHQGMFAAGTVMTGIIAGGAVYLASDKRARVRNALIAAVAVPILSGALTVWRASQLQAA